jgi:hypothetical protein
MAIEAASGAQNEGLSTMWTVRIISPGLSNMIQLLDDDNRNVE